MTVRMALEKVEGVVIRTRDLGEADRIVSLYTREKGKIRAVAKGARRPRNRFASLAQVLVHGRFGVFQSKGLGTLSQGELIASFKMIRTDLLKMAYALFIAELYDHMMEEGDPAPELYGLLLSAMHAIESAQSSDLEKIFIAFALKFLALMGYALELDQCVKCGGEVSSAARISPKLGGLVCGACSPDAPDAVEVSLGMIQVMRRLFKSSFRIASSLRVPDRDLRTIGSVARNSLGLQLSSPLKSMDFLESMICERPS